MTNGRERWRPWGLTRRRSGVPALVAAMKDPHPVARRYACDALAAISDQGEAALQPLLAAMGDPDLWVRNDAGRSLASHGEAAAEAVPAPSSGCSGPRIRICEARPPWS